KAIVFREVEKLVADQPWYQGGYRANIVAYAIAKLGSDVKHRGLCVDFDSIWKNQAISKGFHEALTKAALEVHNIIVEPPPHMRNVTEWAKQQACWNRVEELEIVWPKAWLATLITDDDRKTIQKYGIKEQKMLNGIEAQTAVFNAGGEIWRSIQEWGLSKQLVSQKEVEILDVASSIPSRIPSEKQSLIILETLKELRKEGCQLGPDIV
ncbi:MAG: AIPR family protein, partial [Candidatus Latescibacterota bacterium]